ncbi:MAG: hypothetical protein ACREP2_14850 [Rhodanobacteraceae bacterium]
MPALQRGALAGLVGMLLFALVPVRAAELAPGETTMNTTLFADISHIDQYRNGMRTGNSGNGVDLKRFYISIDHGFSNVWSVHTATAMSTRNW